MSWLVELLQYDERVNSTNSTSHVSSSSTATPRRSLVTPLGQETSTATTRTSHEQASGASSSSSSSPRVFFDYITRSYAHFLAGDDAAVAQLDEETSALFASRSRVAASELEALAQGRDSLVQQLETARTEPSELEQLRTKREELLKDITSFDEHVTRLQAAVEKERNKANERALDDTNVRAELTALREANDVMEQQVAAQKMTAADAARINREQAELERAIEEIGTRRGQTEIQMEECRRSLDAIYDKLDGLVASYAAMGTKLQLLPASAKRAKGQDLAIPHPVRRIRRLGGGGPLGSDAADAATGAGAGGGGVGIPGPKENGGVGEGGEGAGEKGSRVGARVGVGGDIHAVLGGLNMKVTVRPVLQRLQDEYSTKTRDRVVEETRLKEKLESVQMRLSDVRGVVQREEAAVAAAETNAQRLRAEMELEHQHAERQLERLRGELQGLRVNGNSKLAASEGGVEQLEAAVRECRLRCERERTELHAKLTAVFDAVLELKGHVGQGLGQLGHTANMLAHEWAQQNRHQCISTT